MKQHIPDHSDLIETVQTIFEAIDLTPRKRALVNAPAHPGHIYTLSTPVFIICGQKRELSLQAQTQTPRIQ